MFLTIKVGVAKYNLNADNYSIQLNENYETHGGWIDISKVYPAKIRDEYLNYIRSHVDGPFSFWFGDKYTDCIIIDNLSADINEFFKHYYDYHIITIESELVKYTSQKDNKVKYRLVVKKLFVELD